MGAAAEWTEPRGTLRSRPRAALSRSPGAPLPDLLPRNILKRHRRRHGGHSTRYLSRGARWTIACDAQKRGLLAHLSASAGPPCRLIYYQNNQEMENTLYLTISLRVLSPISSIPLRVGRYVDGRDRSFTDHPHSVQHLTINTTNIRYLNMQKGCQSRLFFYFYIL